MFNYIFTQIILLGWSKANVDFFLQMVKHGLVRSEAISGGLRGHLEQLPRLPFFQATSSFQK